VNDPNRIGTVEVALSNPGTGLWWNAKIASWQATICWNLASSVSVVPTSGTFEFPFVGVTRGGAYRATVRAIDPWGNLSTKRPSVAFSISP
jgi:hypothetical protein